MAAQLPSNAAIQAAFRAYGRWRSGVAVELLDAADVKAFTTEAEGHRKNVRLRGASAAGEVLVATSGLLPLSAGMSS